MQLGTLFVIISTQVALSATTTGFAKDENENLVEFPPTILRTFDSSIPVGHLRPLGSFAVCLFYICLSFLVLLFDRNLIGTLSVA